MTETNRWVRPGVADKFLLGFQHLCAPKLSWHDERPLALQAWNVLGIQVGYGSIGQKSGSAWKGEVEAAEDGCFPTHC